MTNHGFHIKLLGQAGCRLQLGETVVYIDPYLSNSVAEMECSDYKRLRPVPIWPKDVSDADFVFITHDHIDHCDPHTIPCIHRASPTARFVGPAPVIHKLQSWGIPPNLLFEAFQPNWEVVSSDLKWRCLPAAHPVLSKDRQGKSNFVGYLFDWSGHRIYHSGDTSLNDDVFTAVSAFKPIHTVILPVNERNYFKERKGIVGNLTIREAFLFAESLQADNFIPVHWDMFGVNSVSVSEIQCTFDQLKHTYNLLIDPAFISKRRPDVTIVIRTLNESRYLESLLAAIAAQDESSPSYEVLVVDSGSTDRTLEIAESHECRIFHIDRSDFSFGRSLNIGCEAALGKIIVMVSGHCVPCDNFWLGHLCAPLLEGRVDYVYGKQVGGEFTAPSERTIFRKYFPAANQIPQEGYFCNNANSALLKSQWIKHRFDEELTGLEDIEFAKRLVESDGKVGYVASAAVFHYHHESAGQIKRRFEREALALRRIKPQVHLSLYDIFLFFVSGVLADIKQLREEKRLSLFSLRSIIVYRANQYWGAYVGNHKHRKISESEKLKYFFPTTKKR